LLKLMAKVKKPEGAVVASLYLLVKTNPLPKDKTVEWFGKNGLRAEDVRKLRTK